MSIWEWTLAAVAIANLAGAALLAVAVRRYFADRAPRGGHE